MSECPICYEHVTEDTGSVNLSCKHTFHLRCITDWFAKQSQGSCPCCRKDMGEKEDILHNEPVEDETLTYVSESIEEENELEKFVNTITLGRQQASAILNIIAGFELDNTPRFSETTWRLLVNTDFYRKEEVSGEIHIRFNYDELRAFVMSRVNKDLSRDIWNTIVTEQLETVIMNRTQLIDFQREIYSEALLVSPTEWDCMLESDLYIKAEPRYPGETAIRFTYNQLCSIIVNSCLEDLKWNRWVKLLANQGSPLSDAFTSASIDYSIPLRLPPPFKLNSLIALSALLFAVDSRYILVDDRPTNWDLGRSQRLIDSIMNGYPIPSFIVSGYPIRILDGNNRIRAILNFRNNLIPLEDGRFYRELEVPLQEHFNKYNVLVQRYPYTENRTSWDDRIQHYAQILTMD